MYGILYSNNNNMITVVSELSDGALNREQLRPKKANNVVKQKPNDDRPIYEVINSYY